MKTLPKLHPALLYFTVLSRDGSAEERANLRQALATGKTLDAAIAEFVNSAELEMQLR